MMTIRNGVLLLVCTFLWGCSSANDGSIILDASGRHVTGWVVAANGGNHPAAYLADPGACKECHGTDLSGGVSKVSCFSVDRNGISCHPQGPSGHPAGWSDPASHGAHAKAAAAGVNGMAFCANCHGADYRGAGVSQKDCLRCHATAPHPPAPWFGGTYTHKSTDTSNAPVCAYCHTNRANLSSTGAAALPATAVIGTTGCFNNTLCHGVMGHSSDPQPWSDPANHGARAKSDPSSGGNTGFAVCQQCHGTGFNTVNGGSTCFSCHTTAPHPTAANWRSTGTITHTTTGQNNAAVCATCHNSSSPNLAEPDLSRFANAPAGSFNGTTPDCFTASMCHGDVRKTSNCDACHSMATTNPFKSMAGATATSDAKVGAHVKHLFASTQSQAYSANVACSECHTVPSAPTASGTHRNGTNDIVFGSLAKTGSLTPVYSATAGTCANIYCHGASLAGGGSNKIPVWNEANYLSAGCATCHGYPPTTVSNGAATHSTSSNCSGCHTHVNSTNNGFNDATKHINGTVEASGGHTFPNPGSSHKVSSNGTDCLGCHALGTSASVYPVTAGTAPDCRSCHLNANPGTDPQCSDCHGSTANNSAGAYLAGRPIGGTTFPNRAGQHNRSEHIGRSCTACHPFSSGDSRHGWSNRQKSTAAQVGGTGTNITSWNSTTKSCTPTCHGTEQWR